MAIQLIAIRPTDGLELLPDSPVSTDMASFADLVRELENWQAADHRIKARTAPGGSLPPKQVGWIAVDEWWVILEPEGLIGRPESLERLSAGDRLAFAVLVDPRERATLIDVFEHGAARRQLHVRAGKVECNEGAPLPHEPLDVAAFANADLFNVVGGLGLDMQAVMTRGKYQLVTINERAPR